MEKVLELTEGVDFGAIADRIEDGFAFITDEAIPAVLDLKDNLVDLAENGIGWVKDNADWLIPVVSGLTAGFVAYKAITLGVAAAEAIKIRRSLHPSRRWGCADGHNGTWRRRIVFDVSDNNCRCGRCRVDSGGYLAVQQLGYGEGKA